MSIIVFVVADNDWCWRIRCHLCYCSCYMYYCKDLSVSEHCYDQ